MLRQLESQPEISWGRQRHHRPSGHLVKPPLGQGEILTPTRPTAIIEARYDFDVIGHYARPDVFTLLVNDEPHVGIDYSCDLTFEEEEWEE